MAANIERSPDMEETLLEVTQFYNTVVHSSPNLNIMYEAQRYKKYRKHLQHYKGMIICS